MKEIVLVVLTCCANSFAQHFIPAASFNAIASEFSGEQAQEYTRQIIQYHRIQGSPMMAEVAARVVLPALKTAGLEARIEQLGGAETVAEAQADEEVTTDEPSETASPQPG